MDMNLDYNTACNAYENEDYKTAFELFFGLAKEGDVSSQMNIANMLLHGLGVNKDEEKAYECYQQAADNEDSEAQYLYGWYCLEKDNFEEGLKYFNLASNADYEKAVDDLAGFYSFGMYECKVDMKKAAILYERSVLLGNEESMNALFHAKAKAVGIWKTILYFIKNGSRLLKALKA